MKSLREAYGLVLAASLRAIAGKVASARVVEGELGAAPGVQHRQVSDNVVVDKPGTAGLVARRRDHSRAVLDSRHPIAVLDIGNAQSSVLNARQRSVVATQSVLVGVGLLIPIKNKRNGKRLCDGLWRSIGRWLLLGRLLLRAQRRCSQ